MPLSRQTSRIVWPSKPSTTRPSTSIRMRGDDCGRCGDCVSRSRSASDSLSIDGAAVGAGDQVGHDRLHEVAPAATAIGWQTPAGQALRTMCSSSSDRKYRIPLLSGRVVRRSWSHRADADDVGGQVLEELRVGRARAAVDDAVGDLDEAAGPDPARDGLAAGLAGAEARQEPGEVDDAGSIVGDDDRARADVGAGGAERLEVVGRVEQVGREEAAGRAADEDGLDRPTGRQLAAERDDVAQRRPERDLGDAVAGRRPDLDEDRARAVGRADRRERLGAVADDPGHRGDRLDVVDDRRHAEQAALGGMRRPLLGLAALALERLQQDGLLAEHVGALDGPDRDDDVVPGAEGIEPDEARVLRRADGGLEPPDGLGRVRADGDDDVARADGEGGDGRALDDRERVAFEEEPVRAGRRVRAVAVDDDVAAGGVRGRGGPPLGRGREAGAAPAAQAGAGDHRDRRASRRSCG